MGRLRGAAIRIQDPRVSEAHALITLRGAQFVMLALRGRLRLVGGEARGRIDLQAGQRIELNEGVEVVVDAVAISPTLLAILGLEPDPVPLLSPEISLVGDPLHLVPHNHGDAVLRVWRSQAQWWIGPPAGAPAPLRVGHRQEVDGHELRWELVSTSLVSVDPTTLREFWPPLEVDVFGQHTELLLRGEGTPHRLTGNLHSMVRWVATMARLGHAVHWLEVAKRIWRVNHTRANWYRTLGRLKGKLRDLRLPENLVETKAGLVRLALRPDVDRIRMHAEDS